MAPRIPLPEDFPSSLVLSIVPPPASAPQPSNILLLLHGLGDTATSFRNLGQQLALPETSCISLQAPTPLPFELGGFHWADDIQFDSSSEQMEFDSGFTKVTQILKEDVIKSGLIAKCGYSIRDIMMLGFGQGGMIALATACSMTEELGGVISIGGPLPSSAASSPAVSTPVILLGGSSNTLVTRTAVANVKNNFRNVEYHKWDRPGDAMPRNRSEMLPIMRFFARRLKTRKGVPEGSVEIG